MMRTVTWTLDLGQDVKELTSRMIARRHLREFG